MPTLTLDQLTRRITVGAPDTEVTCQELVNAIRDWQDELENMNCADFIMASGKEDLGGGLQVGITLKLLNWKVKFEDRPGPNWIRCRVTRGNLVAVDANNLAMDPIEPSAYVSPGEQVAVSAALVQDADIDAIKAKTDNLPSDPGDQSLIESHVSTKVQELKEPTSDGYDREKDSLKKLSEKLDEILSAPPAASFSV